MDVTVSPLFSDTYISQLYSGKRPLLEILKAYVKRLGSLTKSFKYDLLIVEKELFPYFPSFLESALVTLRIPYIVDYDDAVFHRYDLSSNVLVKFFLENKIDRVMNKAKAVIAGNRYLADRAIRAGSQKVYEVPTVVNTEVYTPVKVPVESESDLVVGWIGSPSTSHYLKTVIPVIKEIKKDRKIRFVAIGAKAEQFHGEPVEVWNWSAEAEVALLQQIDIGIMPLHNTPWDCGKCGYKLIQFMACSIPVLATPVGANLEIVLGNECGYFADTPQDWKDGIEKLLNLDPAQRHKMGSVGRRRVEEWYSVKVQGPRLLEIIKQSVN